MKERLLEYLACPSCAASLRLGSVSATDGGEVIQGRLACVQCARSFPVERGVPRFADLGSIEGEKAATAEKFGWQWTHFTQQDERYAAQFLGWISPVRPEFFQDKVVLEGGCGKGRHTQLAARWGARDVIGVDLSAAVESAFEATRGMPNAHILQADIYKLPLKQAFDYAFSVGVLHHLPDPRGGFTSLSGKVKRDGHLSAWVYGAENNGWITRFVNPVRKNITSRISQRALFHLSKLPAAAMFAATKLIYAPLNAHAPAVARHLFYNDYLNAVSHFGFREQHTIVFDHLVAPTAFYISRAEFGSWWDGIGAGDAEIGWHNRNSWRGFGQVIR